ncbi:MAG: tetratricopeptide repeat protein [Acidobacteriia bacterium]|nr:tetratricopeptide repeat protein [Terriglobia bacterium]
MFRRTLLALCVMAGFAVVACAKTESWLEVRTPHFIVLSNSSEKQARHVADQFERMRTVFHKEFPNAHVDAGSPIIVIAVKDKRDFQALEPEVYLAKGQLNLSGLFLRAADKNYVLLRLDAEGEHPYATVYHEYTHFISSGAEEWVPLWLNEGLAEFYQNTEIKEKEVLLGEPSAENLLLLRQNRMLPLTTLLAVDYNSPYYHEENRGSIFYAESWALTHYLEIKDRQENTEHLLDYVKLVSSKVDAVTAATRAFGDLKSLEKELERYVSQGTFFHFQMPGFTEVDASAFKVDSLTLTQADAVRADFLAYNQRVNDSRALLDRVLQEDPSNVAAHETMGFLAFREGKLEEAEKWYEQAVKLDSQNFLAHYYYASIAMREGPNPSRATQIEASLRTATKLNPSFAPAFDRLATFYGMQHKNLDEAHLLSLRAVELDPGNVGFRLNAANVLIAMERPKEAIVVLQNAMKLASNPEQAAAIQSELQSVQQYQAEREREEQESRESSQQRQSEGQSSSPDERPQAGPPVPDHPEDDRHGPRRTVKGTLRDLQCSPPATMRLKVESAAKPVDLRTRNYYKVQYSVLNITLPDDFNPCRDLEGMRAKVEYFEGLNGSGGGQIISIELTK